ncbi:MAG: hypothetical protein BGO51_23600 [Rhodospirillales bacterium 69-11]|nr:glycerophosphodiester phosphodiesterase [Rhodospirillales bacterium]OJW22793.1 MAG: hypothetical protein BGO51_23600 [Rhodospirillales bacterium 69-11]
MTRRFDLQGHRGARGLFPENTIEGFRAALAIGVDMFELDVGLSADGIPVVHHDLGPNPAVARGADGAWLDPPTPLLHALTRAEIARYDVGRLRPGSAYAAQFPEQRPIDGARIPTLAAVLDVDPAVGFNLELKTDPTRPDATAPSIVVAEAALAVVEQGGATGRVMFESFDWRGPRHLRRLRPDLRFAWLTDARSVADAALWWDGPHPGDFGGSVPRAVAAEGGGVWAPAHAELTGELVAEAHDLGLSVIPWTVNQLADMRRLIAWGVDGLITDYPDRAHVVMAASGLTLPPPRLPPSDR